MSWIWRKLTGKKKQKEVLWDYTLPEDCSEETSDDGLTEYHLFVGQNFCEDEIREYLHSSTHSIIRRRIQDKLRVTPQNATTCIELLNKSYWELSPDFRSVSRKDFPG